MKSETKKIHIYSLLVLVFSLVVFFFIIFTSPAAAVDLPFNPDKCGFYAE
ncbi:MAG: hypothetical protein WCW64_11640 [Phycisphaerae bacterium]